MACSTPPLFEFVCCSKSLLEFAEIVESNWTEAIDVVIHCCFLAESPPHKEERKHLTFSALTLSQDGIELVHLNRFYAVEHGRA